MNEIRMRSRGRVWMLSDLVRFWYESEEERETITLGNGSIGSQVKCHNTLHNILQENLQIKLTLLSLELNSQRLLVSSRWVFNSWLGRQMLFRYSVSKLISMEPKSLSRNVRFPQVSANPRQARLLDSTQPHASQNWNFCSQTETEKSGEKMWNVEIDYYLSSELSF